MTIQEPRPTLDALLQPSLGARAPVEPIYSLTATYLVAFFGGGLAVILFTASNSRRLHRLERDAWWLGMGALFFLTWPVMVILFDWADALDFMDDPHRSVRFLSRALGLAFVGVIYAQHRIFHRAMNLSGEEPPSAWKAGIVCTALATGISLLAVLTATWVAS